MMRKEVKLGLAIGGVLLAVLVVYVLVVTGPDARPGQVSLVTSPEHEDEAQAQAQPEPAPAPQPEPARDPFTTSPQAPAPAQPAQSASDVWSMALNSGRLPELMTQTPTPTIPPAIASPQPVGANTSAEGASAQPLASNAPAIVSGPSTQPSSDAIPATYKVKEGESFSTIAAELYGSANYYPHLIRANPTIDPRKLRPGMTINVPPKSQVVAPAAPTAAPGATAAPAQPALDARTEYRVEPGDSLYRISVKLYGKPDKVEAIYDLNKSTIGPNQANLKVGMVLKLPTPPTVTATAGR